MGFKLKGAPYDKSNMNIAVYKKDLTDGSIGKSNHTGIIVQSGISPEEEQHVIAHEKVHQEQQAKGELDYDKENFYWKGKTYPREKLNEHNEELPWEKEAYKASEKSRNKESKDMGSTKFKLKGHRGNNKPFKHMTERGLIGASMDDTSGYNQPDYGSSMYDDDGASAPGEGDPKKVTKETRTTKKDINPETGIMQMTTQVLANDLAYTINGDRVIYSVTVVVTDQGVSGLSGSVVVSLNTTEDYTKPTLAEETFWVEENVVCQDMEQAIRESAGKFLTDLTLFDVYHSKDSDNKRRSLSWSLYFQHAERTLTDEEIQACIQSVIASVESNCRASIRSE